MNVKLLRRLIYSAAEVDYPKNKFEIQLVDDSNDETCAIIDKLVDELKNDVDIYVVRRDDRDQFKAGALANALKYAKGNYSAIFDSDFLIPKNFLKRSMAQLHPDENMACVSGTLGTYKPY